MAESQEHITTELKAAEAAHTRLVTQLRIDRTSPSYSPTERWDAYQAWQKAFYALPEGSTSSLVHPPYSQYTTSSGQSCSLSELKEELLQEYVDFETRDFVRAHRNYFTEVAVALPKFPDSTWQRLFKTWDKNLDNELANEGPLPGLESQQRKIQQAFVRYERNLRLHAQSEEIRAFLPILKDISGDLGEFILSPALKNKLIDYLGLSKSRINRRPLKECFDLFFERIQTLLIVVHAGKSVPDMHAAFQQILEGLLIPNTIFSALKLMDNPKAGFWPELNDDTPEAKEMFLANLSRYEAALAELKEIENITEIEGFYDDYKESPVGKLELPRFVDMAAQLHFCFMERSPTENKYAARLESVEHDGIGQLAQLERNWIDTMLSPLYALDNSELLKDHLVNAIDAIKDVTVPAGYPLVVAEHAREIRKNCHARIVNFINQLSEEQVTPAQCAPVPQFNAQGDAKPLDNALAWLDEHRRNEMNVADIERVIHNLDKKIQGLRQFQQYADEKCSKKYRALLGQIGLPRDRQAKAYFKHWSLSDAYDASMDTAASLSLQRQSLLRAKTNYENYLAQKQIAEEVIKNRTRELTRIDSLEFHEDRFNRGIEAIDKLFTNDSDLSYMSLKPDQSINITAYLGLDVSLNASRSFDTDEGKLVLAEILLAFNLANNENKNPFAILYRELKERRDELRKIQQARPADQRVEGTIGQLTEWIDELTAKAHERKGELHDQLRWQNDFELEMLSSQQRSLQNDLAETQKKFTAIEFEGTGDFSHLSIGQHNAAYFELAKKRQKLEDGHASLQLIKIALEDQLGQIEELEQNWADINGADINGHFDLYQQQNIACTELLGQIYDKRQDIIQEQALHQGAIQLLVTNLYQQQNIQDPNVDIYGDLKNCAVLRLIDKFIEFHASESFRLQSEFLSMMSGPHGEYNGKAAQAILSELKTNQQIFKETADGLISDAEAFQAELEVQVGGESNSRLNEYHQFVAAVDEYKAAFKLHRDRTEELDTNYDAVLAQCDWIKAAKEQVVQFDAIQRRYAAHDRQFAPLKSTALVDMQRRLDEHKRCFQQAMEGRQHDKIGMAGYTIQRLADTLPVRAPEIVEEQQRVHDEFKEKNQAFKDNLDVLNTVLAPITKKTIRRNPEALLDPYLDFLSKVELLAIEVDGLLTNAKLVNAHDDIRSLETLAANIKKHRDFRAKELVGFIELSCDKLANDIRENVTVDIFTREQKTLHTLQAGLELTAPNNLQHFFTHVIDAKNLVADPQFEKTQYGRYRERHAKIVKAEKFLVDSRQEGIDLNTPEHQAKLKILDEVSYPAVRDGVIENLDKKIAGFSDALIDAAQNYLDNKQQYDNLFRDGASFLNHAPEILAELAQWHQYAHWQMIPGEDEGSRQQEFARRALQKTTANIGYYQQRIEDLQEHYNALQGMLDFLNADFKVGLEAGYISDSVNGLITMLKEPVEFLATWKKLEKLDEIKADLLEKKETLLERLHEAKWVKKKLEQEKHFLSKITKPKLIVKKFSEDPDLPKWYGVTKNLAFVEFISSKKPRITFQDSNVAEVNKILTRWGQKDFAVSQENGKSLGSNLKREYQREIKKHWLPNEKLVLSVTQLLGLEKEYQQTAKIWGMSRSEFIAVVGEQQRIASASQYNQIQRSKQAAEANSVKIILELSHAPEEQHKKVNTWDAQSRPEFDKLAEELKRTKKVIADIQKKLEIKSLEKKSRPFLENLKHTLVEHLELLAHRIANHVDAVNNHIHGELRLVNAALDSQRDADTVQASIKKLERNYQHGMELLGELKTKLDALEGEINTKLDKALANTRKLDKKSLFDRCIVDGGGTTILGDKKHAHVEDRKTEIKVIDPEHDKQATQMALVKAVLMVIHQGRYPKNLSGLEENIRLAAYLFYAVSGHNKPFTVSNCTDNPDLTNTQISKSDFKPGARFYRGYQKHHEIRGILKKAGYPEEAAKLDFSFMEWTRKIEGKLDGCFHDDIFVSKMAVMPDVPDMMATGGSINPDPDAAYLPSPPDPLGVRRTPQPILA